MEPSGSFIGYFNPFSDEFAKATRDFDHLSGFNQFLAVTASIFAGLFGLGIASFAAFRFTVEKLSKGDDSIADRVDSVAKDVFSDDEEDDLDIDNLTDPQGVDQVPTDIEPQEDPFGLDILEIRTLMENAELLAPNVQHPLTVEIDGSSYVIWYKSALKTVNIQLAEEFRNSRHDNKIGISIQNGQIKLYFENLPITTLDEDKKAFIEQLPNLLRDLKMTHEQMQLEKRKFNTDSLKLLREFFLGNNGLQHINSNPLRLGDYKMWYRQINEEPSRMNPTGSSLFILNLQKNEDYRSGTQANKLGISVDASGEVQTVFVDGEEIDPLDVFSVDHPWNKKLADSLNVFLQENAVNTGHASLTTHSVAIARQPEYVFSKVQPGQTYNFYDNKLDVQPGIDAGGPKRQFFSELALHLFDGAPGRQITVESGVPTLSSDAPADAKELLTRIGSSLFYPCFHSADYTLGRILNDSFFSALHFLLSNPDIDDDTMVDACEFFISQDHPQWLFEVYRNPRQLQAEEKMMLEDILCVVDEVPTDLAGIKQVVKDTIVNELQLGDKVRAAKCVADGMLQAAGQHAQALKSTSAVDLSNAIQGIAINKADIANRISTSSYNLVVREKTQWLKEYILASDEDEIRKFLITVTGSSTVTATTQIRIDETSAHNCSAHTCFKSIDVPTHHTDVGTAATAQNPTNKEKFINNLRLTYAAAGFDMG